MRLIALAVAAITLAAGPAQAAWKEYVYSDLGIAKYFPAEPMKETGTYGGTIRLPLSKVVPDTIYSVVDDGVLYKLTVVDFKGRAADGASILAEAVSALGNRGTVAEVGFPRLDLGSASVYGMVLIVDEKDGDHTTSGVFFTKEKLYLVQAMVPQNSPARTNSGIGRFIETVRFHLEGYGFDSTIGHDYPLGCDDPGNRDLGNNRPTGQNLSSRGTP
jgi:hypothetical protein